jgi:hypothetical protein
MISTVVLLSLCRLPGGNVLSGGTDSAGGRTVDAMSDRLIYRVTCERWERGLVLHIDGVGVTQTHEDYPDTAEDMARSYISLMLDVPENSFDVAITDLETTAAIHEDDHQRRVREAAEQAGRISRGLAERLAEDD